MANWDTLISELDAWTDAGRTATLWWRDDDAISATPALDNLVALANTYSVPAGLAVIPASADNTLADIIRETTQLSVLQHGLAHANHAPTGQKKSELGTHRMMSEVLEDIAAGARQLTEQFPHALPVLVPPWNRIADSIVRQLTPRGITGLSTFQPRDATVPNLTIVNTHVDIIDWRGTRGFAGTNETLSALHGHLRARRLKSVEPSEPTGLLTHHLVHTPDCWHFMAELFRLTTEHPATQWLSPEDIFATRATG